ncbi:MAG: DUF362 domain-containing protein [Gemmatimonadota bacterium]|nr:MAG: DUF362 domain-containing protein [Gemmatimonadota bacterium]
MKLSAPQKGFLGIILTLMMASFLFQGNASIDDALVRIPLTVRLPEKQVVLPQSTVGIVRSSQDDAQDIGYDEIRAMIEDAVDKAGGFETLIQDGDVVVLKPNLISPYDMSQQGRDLAQKVNGVTTDYRFVKAVAELVRERNPSGEIYVMEGSGVGWTRDNFQALGYTPQRIQDADDFICIEDSSGGWREYDSDKLAAVELPDSLALYPDNRKPNRTRAIYLNRLYYEADVLICLPVLKNHYIGGVTGAIKNVGIGATPASIYGNFGGQYPTQRDWGIDHQYTYLQQWLHDFFLCRPIDYVIMDGLQGLQHGPLCNCGPGYQSPNIEHDQKNMRLVLAGRDAVAVDAIAALIMRHDPLNVPHLTYLHNDHAGCAHAELIRVEGVMVDEVKEDFESCSYGTYSKFYDDTPPEFQIDYAAIEGDMLYLRLTETEEVAKLEVAIDGVRLMEIVIQDFDDIALSIGPVEPVNHQITLFAYDQYLNCTRVELERGDVDDDGIADWNDNCPDDYNPEQDDGDGDEIGDVCDNCQDDFNPDQADGDYDGTGDACDQCTDTDDDGYGDPGYSTNTCDEDNCPETFNPDQIEVDRGDINCEGGSDVLDVLAVVNHILGSHPLAGAPLERADCNGDGGVNVLDALGIVNVILGIGQCAPEAGRPKVTPEVRAFLKSLQQYLPPEEYARFMAMVKGLQIPDQFLLSQNFPNPFNPVTTIQYSVVSELSLPHVSLKIYNSLGQEIRTLVDELQNPGQYTVTWDVEDALGVSAPSGIYFYRLTVGDFTATRRMLLLK